MNYLAQFVPKFSVKAHDLRALLKQDAYWVWEPSHQKCFDNLKAEIKHSACFKYYDTKSPYSLKLTHH